MLGNWLKVAKLIFVNSLSVGGIRGLFGALPVTEERSVHPMALV